jgi:hypothetical protein
MRSAGWWLEHRTSDEIEFSFLNRNLVDPRLRQLSLPQAGHASLKRVATMALATASNAKTTMDSTE